VKTCEFGALEDSTVKDRIAMGVRNDATRRKVLKTKQLDLQTATDMCRAAELANKHMKAMNATTTQSIKKLEANDCRTHQRGHRPRHRSQS
jgi:hypothetical protein